MFFLLYTPPIYAFTQLHFPVSGLGGPGRRQEFVDMFHFA